MPAKRWREPSAARAPPAVLRPARETPYISIYISTSIYLSIYLSIDLSIDLFICVCV